MLIDFISDLHLDFWLPPNKSLNKRKVDNFFKLILPDDFSNTLVIAGDIGHYNKQNISILQYLKEFYENIIVVLGNHDLYLISKSLEQKYNFTYKERIKEFIELCNENNIICLNGQSIEIENKIISGSSLWYDTSKHYDMWLNVMNDGILIQDNPYNKKYHGYVNDVYGKYFKTTFDTNQYYQKELEKMKNIEYCDLFVSHICPIKIPDYFIDKKFFNKPTNIFYYSGIEIENELYRINPKNVIFGHTHTIYSFKENDINFSCNPLGYPDEMKNILGIQTLEI